MNVGELITQALRDDKIKDLLRYEHGPWENSRHAGWPAIRCIRCGIKSLSGVPKLGADVPRWCHPRRNLT